MEDRHLFISPSNELIAISPTEAFIEKYSLDGQLVERVELGELDLFKDIIYTMEEEVKRVSAVSNLFAPIIRDVSLQDNYLFLLFNNVPEGSLQRDHIFSNQIMKINLNKLQENMGIFELLTDNAKPRFSKIAVSSDGESLLAFERSNFEFYRYSLK